MPQINNIKFNTLPQQVSKNKKDIQDIKQQMTIVATAFENGLMSKEDFVKLQALYTRDELDDILDDMLAPSVKYTPTLTNGATATYLKYSKDSDGYVDVWGNITITELNAQNFCFALTLPPGFRPLDNSFIGLDDGYTVTMCQLYLSTAGVFRFNKTGKWNVQLRFPTI